MTSQSFSIRPLPVQGRRRRCSPSRSRSPPSRSSTADSLRRPSAAARPCSRPAAGAGTEGQIAEPPGRRPGRSRRCRARRPRSATPTTCALARPATPPSSRAPSAPTPRLLAADSREPLRDHRVGDPGARPPRLPRGARARASRAHRLAPALVRPYAAIVDGQIELGRYAAAARTLERMVTLKPNLAAYSRVSYFRELNGDLDGAVQALRLAAPRGGGGEALAYIQTLLGRLELDRGNTPPPSSPTARRWRPTRATRPRSAGSGPGRGGSAASSTLAIERYRDVVERLPLPEYAIGLAEAELAAGRQAARATATSRWSGSRPSCCARPGSTSTSSWRCSRPTTATPNGRWRSASAAWRRAPSVRSADAYSWALHSRRARPAALELSARRCGSAPATPTSSTTPGVIAAAAGERDRARDLLGRWSPRARASAPITARAPSGRCEGFGMSARQTLRPCWPRRR